jgi:hypothetical protein
VHRAAEQCELVHNNLCGSIDPPATREEKYFVLFIDDKTRMTAIIGLQSKTAAELLSAFKVYQNLVEKQTGRRIKCFRSDGGGEFQKEFQKHLRA